jgi:hypothetical protein
VVLEKTDAAWRLRAPLDFPADTGAVQSLLASLQSLSVGETLTQRPESHELYQVDDPSGVRVKVWDKGNDAPADWIFGKAAPDNSHVYLRVPGKPEVYLASGLHPEDLKRPLTQWRERRILRLEAEENIVKVEVKQGKASFVVQKSSDAWTVDGKPADSDKTQRFVDALHAANAQDFIDPPESSDLKKFGLDPPAALFLVTTTSGKTLELRAGKPADSQQIPVQRAGEPVLFWLPEHTWNEINPSPKTLLAAEPGTK